MAVLTTENSEQWHVNRTEIGYNIEQGASHSYCGRTASRTWDLYIPKIMPLISMGTRKVSSVSLNSSILANSSECKPTINGTVKTQNFINVPKHPKAKFAQRWKMHGIEVEVEILNHNVDNMRITDTYDNSHALPHELPLEVG